MVRNVQSIVGIENHEIDVAITHGNHQVPAGILQKELMEWEPVIISHFSLKEKKSSCTLITWEPDSVADELTKEVLNACYKVNIINNNQKDQVENKILDDLKENSIRGSSYLNALEMRRRGMPYYVVIPECYLTKSDRRKLNIININKEILRSNASSDLKILKKYLIAIYRESDQKKLSGLLNRNVWESVVYGKNK